MRSLFIMGCLFLAVGWAQDSNAQTVAITDFNDITLGPWMGSGDLSDDDDLCVYNLGVSNYRVRLTGSGTAGAFTLSGPGNPVAYEVQFKDAGAYVDITSGSWANFTGADVTDADCNGLTNANVNVIVRESELGSAEAGSYSGTLTILLETR